MSGTRSHLGPAPDAGPIDHDLVLEGLSVRYGRQTVLAPLDIVVPHGQWLGLIGPNGAGKSSLLRAICGLVPSSGAIRLADTDLTSVGPRHRARNVAYVPQEPIVPDDMAVDDFVLLGRTAYAGRFGLVARRDRRIVADLLDELDLAAFARRPMGALSGGERQRVVLARALAQEAPVLILDEPTSALDIGHQQQALELVSRLRHERDLTVIAAMHDLTLAGTYADRLLLLDAGDVVADGEPSDVLTAERIGRIFQVCVSVDVDPSDGAVIVVPRRGFPVPSRFPAPVRAVEDVV